MSTPDTAEELLYCTVHADRETTLRCNKCGRPMCAQCAVSTPVGYRCKECVRGIQQKYYNATQYDDLIAFGVAAVATAVVVYLISVMRLPLFILFILGFPAGGAISELIVRVIQKRRGRNMAYFGAGGAVIGGLVAAVLQTYIQINNVYAAYRAEFGAQAEVPPIEIGAVLQSTFTNIGVVLAIGIIAAAIYTRLRMRG